MTSIFDLDGCLSDDRARRRQLPDYDTYHSLCGMDPACNVDVYKKSGGPITFITGRPEQYRQQTIKWIDSHLPNRAYTLLMRPDGDLTPSPRLKVEAMKRAGIQPTRVDVAYDDRQDVLEAYKAFGVKHVKLLRAGDEPEKDPVATASVLTNAAKTFAERNAVYGSNYEMVAPLMKVLFPAGVNEDVVFKDVWHLFELVIVKLSRFAISKLTHQDSIHDIVVYAAMIESILQGEEK